MAFLDEVNTITHKEIIPGVADGVFRNSPVLAFLRRNCLMPYPGGPSWQENFLYGVLPSAAYLPGDTFDLSQRQIASGGTVTPRYYNTVVSAYIERLKIELNGPNAVFSQIDLLLQNAALSMSALLTNDLYRHGQTLTLDRVAKINGLDEALNDGSNTGFLAQAYANYLTVARSSVDSALSSPMTGPTANVNGAISYPILEQAYSSVVIGSEHPDLIVTSNLGWSILKIAFQGQQRFESTDPDFGFQALKFNGSSVVPDQYCPGTRTATTADGVVGYSAVSGGETLWFLNTKYMRLYVSTDPLFGFGFTGFLPSQDSSVIAGQYKFAGNFTVQAPRLMRYLFGITA